MSEKYNHKKIEKKWAEKWVKDKSFTPNLEKAKDPYYALFMFPYPSAEGLHIGNFYAFICVDVMAKYKRLQGKAVFEPIGFDAFGMHSENYALKINETPRKMLNRTIANFRKQLSSAGLGCDWTREVDTTTSEYYKWTQWIFTKLFEKGLAYQKEALLNWCPGCKTVLADEQIEDGVCERCKTAPEKKTMKQWFLKITAYAQRLLDGLDDMDWSEITKHAQRNWIGRSEGAKIVFKAKSQKSKVKNEIEVFTTRPDTLFGATYMVLSPEHSLVKKIITPEHKKEVEEYIKKSGAKSDLERAEAKEKTGVFTGAYAVNPVNNEKISIWIADYVLTGYGTGAIMAVPAHDERDFEFAKKYNLPIKKVVIPIFGDKHEQEEYRETITALIYRKKDNKFLYLDDNHYKIVAPIIGGIEKGESIKDAAEREAYEETGYKARFVKKLGGQIESHFFASHKNVWRHRLDQPVLCELLDENAEPDEISKEEDNKHKVIWITAEEALKRIAHGDNKMGLLKYLGKAEVFTGEGRNVNSISLNGLTTKEAKEKMIKWLEEKKVGKKTINYKLRDWCISRQRYWGPPVPIVYCDKCGVQSVPEKDLPVKLPEMEKDWEPAGDGRGPLAKVDGFMKTVCPKCGGFAEREPDVMDNFLDSAWYFFRYIDTKNGKEIFDKKLGKKWLPVDFYVGGNEHAVLHLMYTRFITMDLHDLGLINFDNPFKKFRANGMILKDGKKMSKSKGTFIKAATYLK
ncbi:class I tRNA ligase family protein, partial [Candidatus Parcubacteria bacterium]|nr:class I tRNA ligase family protein [Candidatus Parcubacteria bacterium]